MCHECVDKAGSPTLEQLDMIIEDLDPSLNTSPETRASALVFLTSLWTGPDEGKITELTGLSVSEVSVRGDRLRKGGAWADGKVCLDKESEDGPAECNIVLIMNIMLANGDLLRVPTGP